VNSRTKSKGHPASATAPAEGLSVVPQCALARQGAGDTQNRGPAPSAGARSGFARLSSRRNSKAGGNAPRSLHFRNAGQTGKSRPVAAAAEASVTGAEATAGPNPNEAGRYVRFCDHNVAWRKRRWRLRWPFPRNWVETYAAPPVPASGFGANPDMGGQFNLTRLSSRDTSGKDSYNGSEPWRLIQCPAGKIAGKVSGVDHKNAQISFVLREQADVKGDFHETENYAKQNCNMLWNSMLQSGARPVKRIQTIALGSNHRVCGVICRDKRRLLWRG
jgi:hypothetical protein